MDKRNLYFMCRKIDPAHISGIPGADVSYRASLMMVKGDRGGYYVATTSEESARRIVAAMNLDAYVQGDKIEASIWHDFSRSKVVCLRSEQQVDDFLARRAKLDFDQIADWVT
jgi:hypothetical protein